MSSSNRKKNAAVVVSQFVRLLLRDSPKARIESLQVYQINGDSPPELVSISKVDKIDTETKLYIQAKYVSEGQEYTDSSVVRIADGGELNVSQPSQVYDIADGSVDTSPHEDWMSIGKSLNTAFRVANAVNTAGKFLGMVNR
ncbi:MAG: hypothetical protein IH872_04155 [Chloroflexi bacterium]|nr:hypothetical protein [Chloroflexota bacterium]